MIVLKLINFVWSVSCRAHLNSISRVFFFSKSRCLFRISVLSGKGLKVMKITYWPENFDQTSNFFINKIFCRDTWKKLKLLFFDFLYTTVNSEHFCLLQDFSYSARLVVRAVCQKIPPVTSALVKNSDVAGLSDHVRYFVPYI